jgi:hypothetical protein
MCRFFLCATIGLFFFTFLAFVQVGGFADALSWTGYLAFILAAVWISLAFLPFIVYVAARQIKRWRSMIQPI